MAAAAGRCLKSDRHVLGLGECCIGTPMFPSEVHLMNASRSHDHRSIRSLGLLWGVVRGCLLAALGASTLAPAGAEPAAFVPLSGQQIRSSLRGNFVGDGRHWEHRYLPDGRLTRHESGRIKAGRWSVQRDQLCLLQPEVSSTEPMCFSVHQRANELQYLDGKRVVYQGFFSRNSR